MICESSFHASCTLWWINSNCRHRACSVNSYFHWLSGAPFRTGNVRAEPIISGALTAGLWAIDPSGLWTCGLTGYWRVDGMSISLLHWTKVTI